MMKKELSLLLTLLLSSNIFCSPDFAGNYKCKGFDPYLNKAYSGTISIIPQNTVYRLEMKYDTGEISQGTGGAYDDSLLSVVFQNTKKKNLVGLEQYTFTKDKKSIQGYWVYLANDKLGKEVCEKT